MSNYSGEITRNEQQKVYWSVFNGKLSRKAHEGEEGAATRTNKLGKKVIEVYRDGLEGVLYDINIDETTFDKTKVKSLKITLTNDGIHHIINFPKESRYFGSFLEKVPNVKDGFNIQVRPYNFEDENEKKIIGVNVFQSGVKLASAYKVKVGEKWTYNHGFPPFPEKWNTLADRDKKIYFMDVDDFWENAVKDWRMKYAPDYRAVANDYKEAASAQSGGKKGKANSKPEQHEEESDTLPF